ncbi:hypothetical protein [Micromonospora avicenniae]|uniref:hypothetical protein n=1 Tax=Micromonospora avicenniae TaxID=1198245 RepID=UPI003334278A
MADEPAALTRARRLLRYGSSNLTGAIAAWSVFFTAYWTWHFDHRLPAGGIAYRVAWLIPLALAPTFTAWRWATTPADQRWGANRLLLLVAALSL